MSVRVDIERLVVHDIALAPADRRRLLAAVQHRIAEQLSAATVGRDVAGGAVPLIRSAPITLAAAEPAGTQVHSLAAGIAGAATAAVTQPRGGTP
jgi:hypothetical protein